jgi:CheY-like chemotaxis protein
MSAAATPQRTVLVVEDNQDDAELLKLALRRAGLALHFRFASGSHEALAYLKGEAPFADRQANPFPDLMLLDLKLSGMDGFDLLELVRTLSSCGRLKVFAWTGWENPEYAARARSLGVEQFYLKPSSSEGWKGLLSGIAAAIA